MIENEAESIRFLYNLGIFPFVKNEMTSYMKHKREVEAISKGILGKKVLFYFVDDDSLNAFVVKIPNNIFIGITDSLLQEFGFDVSKVLNSNESVDFFNILLNYSYTLEMFEPSEESIRQGLKPDCELNPKLDLIVSCIDLMAIFIYMHEVSHISLGHLEPYSLGKKFCEFPENSTVSSNGSILKEFQADSNAACWMAQRVTSVSKDNSDELTKRNFACSCIGMFTLLMTMPKYIDESQAHVTHPRSQDRLMNTIYWFWIAFAEDNKEKDLDAFFDILIGSYKLVEEIGKKNGNYIKDFDPNMIKDYTKSENWNKST